MLELQNAEKKATKEVRGSVKSATRVLDLFEFLGRWDSVKSHTEIADELDIPKSSLTQLLKTLASRRYLEYDNQRKGYRIGPAISELAQRPSASASLLDIGRSVLEIVVDETGESCAINLLKGDEAEVVVGKMSMKRKLVYHMHQGDSAPLYATSGGKALLAYLPEDMIKDFIARTNFQEITHKTITEPSKLLEELQQVRETGFAYVSEEFTLGICGIARAILSPAGYPLASINVAVPSSRLTQDCKVTCEKSLKRASHTIASRYKD